MGLDSSKLIFSFVLFEKETRLYRPVIPNLRSPSFNDNGLSNEKVCIVFVVVISTVSCGSDLVCSIIVSLFLQMQVI